MKDFVKRIFFSSTKPNRVLSGISSGMTAQYNPKDRALHLLGLYEREIHPFLKRAIRSADTLIDIGANDGYYGLAFLKQKGKEIILCEPGNEERTELINNMTLNGFKEKIDYTLVDKFVSDKSNQNEISINDLVKSKNNIFILMDIEGAEEQVVEGFDFRNNAKVSWLIETHSAAIEEKVVALFKAHRYDTTIINNAWWRKLIPENRPLGHNRWLYAQK